jgi:Flp pilus assembly protein TadG
MFSALRIPNRERGQMLVIVALGLTVLIAMAGLIIDGGMALSNRRQVQNAADAASLAGTRVLGLDLKWRADNRPPPAPFANVDQAVCDAINDALVYNTNAAQSIAAIDCYAGSDDAQYVDYNRNVLGRVGDGVPSLAQGVRVAGTGASGTFLMGVIGIESIDVGADATALAGPGEPPLGQLMPFVAQNPLGPFIPGNQYQIRSEDEGECDTGAVDSHLADLAGASGVAMASYVQPKTQDRPFAAPQAPSVPIANPASSTFTTSITVTLSAKNNVPIHYTTDGSTPTAASATYAGPLTFTATTTLKAIAVKNGQSSEIGTFNYTQANPPAVVTATPGDGTTFTTTQSVTLNTITPGSTIYYTINGTNPTTSSSVYVSAISLSASTQIRAMASKGGVNSAVTTFNYTKAGATEPPVANPVSGTEFATTLNVILTTPTPGATIWYTVNGSDPRTSPSRTQYVPPLSLVSTTTVRAYATAGGVDSLIVDFTYTKTGPVCPELTSGNFGWIDYSGGSNSNADLKHEIAHPEDADISWYYRNCTGASDTNCRDPHNPADAADDHWLVEGTPGHRDTSLRLVCDLYLGQIIYVPIWDDFSMLPGKKPNGNNAVFHIIGFAAFRLDGVIDNKNNGDPSNDACGTGLSLGGRPNDKGFVGTYVDSFVGTQVAPCIPSADGTNPCQNLQNDRLEINLAD